MGKKLKKGKEGPSKEYISRARAIKKLQVSLKDFRRLCILKGIYPRDPPKKLKRTNKTYYHIKDVNFLNHETILEKFREKKAHIKKIKRAIASGQKLKAAKLKKQMPRYNLNHLVKERYPTFVDALNDLDDPLSLISLFASFPAHKEHKIQNEITLNCQRLLKQFQVYVAKTHSLRKVFLSIKGIYYQASIQGISSTWIQPYPLSPSMPLDVDYKVMSTFLEFYQVMMRFVNFKLLGREIDFGVNPYIGNELRKLVTEDSEQRNKDENYQIDEKFQEDEQVQRLQNKKTDDPYSLLFQNLCFFLSNEAPKASLEFVILSFGGKVTWTDDGQNIDEKLITHVVTERQLEKVKNREYIQPQWVYDCINRLTLLPVKDYAPEKVLPPHLSPFDETEQQNHDVQDIEVEEDNESDEDGNKPKVMAPKRDQKKEEIKKQKQNLLKKQEQKKLAESTLTRKNKRLYDMVKRKEQEEQEKKDAILTKKKALQKQQ